MLFLFGGFAGEGAVLSPPATKRSISRREKQALFSANEYEEMMLAPATRARIASAMCSANEEGRKKSGADHRKTKHIAN